VCVTLGDYEKRFEYLTERLKMYRMKILLIMIVSLNTVCMANGQEKKLGVTLDLTYMSKYMSKGGEAYGQQGGFFKTIYFDLWDSGFGFSAKHRNATSSGYVDKQRFDYTVYYGNKFFADNIYETKYKFSWAYEHYPGLARNKANTTQEWNFVFSWPKILSGGLIPKYAASYEYPSGSGYDRRDVTGWVHLFGLGYDLNVSELPNPLRLSADVSYRDGLGGRTKDHDWSHATLGISTKFRITDNLSFVPALYHQITMDDSVCGRDDITYCHLSFNYKF